LRSFSIYKRTSTIAPRTVARYFTAVTRRKPIGFSRGGSRQTAHQTTLQTPRL